MDVPWIAVGLASVATAIAVFAARGWRPGAKNWKGLPIAHRDVIESMRDGVVIANSAGMVLDVNPAAEKILGCSGDSVRTRQFDSLLSELAIEVDRDAISESLVRLGSPSAPWVGQIETADGRQIEITAARGVHSRGPEGRFAVLRDRTQERRDDRAARRSEKLESVGTLASGLAHEMNNPLAFIRTNLSQISRMGELVEQKLDDPREKLADELRELQPIADEALDGIARIEQIVSDMRRFSEGRREAFGPVDVNASVSDAIRLANLNRETGIHVRTHLGQGLPPIEGSQQRLVQALLNLLVNSRQALSSTPDASIDIETGLEGDCVAVQIHDNGPGIAKDLQERIFDPFFTTKEPGAGTGLGLAISDDIVRDHRGTLEVRSRPGEGAWFIVLLPISRD